MSIPIRGLRRQAVKIDTIKGNTRVPERWTSIGTRCSRPAVRRSSELKQG